MSVATVFTVIKLRETTPVQLHVVERFLGNFLLGFLLKDSDDKSNPEPVPYNTILFLSLEPRLNTCHSTFVRSVIV